MGQLNAYIARESAIGSVINLVIGSAFFLVVFRGQSDPAVWGPGGLILDCVPQGFMIGLMSIIPAMLITRMRVAKGLSLPVPSPTRTVLPSNPFLRGILVALASMVCLVGVAAALAWATGAQSLPFWPAFVLKALPGIAVPWIVCSSAIKVALAPRAAPVPISS